MTAVMTGRTSSPKSTISTLFITTYTTAVKSETDASGRSARNADSESRREKCQRKVSELVLRRKCVEATAIPARVLTIDPMAQPAVP